VGRGKGRKSRNGGKSAGKEHLGYTGLFLMVHGLVTGVYKLMRDRQKAMVIKPSLGRQTGTNVICKKKRMYGSSMTKERKKERKKKERDVVRYKCKT
jgi:hypothetical protein